MQDLYRMICIIYTERSRDEFRSHHTVPSSCIISQNTIFIQLLLLVWLYVSGCLPVYARAVANFVN